MNPLNLHQLNRLKKLLSPILIFLPAVFLALAFTINSPQTRQPDPQAVLNDQSMVECSLNKQNQPAVRKDLTLFPPTPDLPTEQEVRDGILRAARAFYQLSYKGGYPYMISTDLQTRYNCGHGIKNIFPDETYISIEPPGTPWAGRAFLRSYRVTGDESLLRMAKETGDALATVQLEVGGWRMRQPLTNEYADTFKPDHIPSAGFYPSPPQADFDDNRTQGPLLFFIELVRDGSDSELHKKALQKGLDMLLEAQYPSGGWPQYYPLTLKSGYSILDNYRRYNHINDGCIPGIMEVLLTAYQVFGNREYLDAVILAADWLMDVRLPNAAWAQQYYDDFVTGPQKPNSPAPGRWFEPIAITASETSSVLEILREVWLETGNHRYIEPFQEIAKWYQRSQIEPGKWARLYELHTNRPLYCTPDQIITYSDENLRPGYAWKGSWGNQVLEIVKQISEPCRDRILAQRKALPDKAGITRLGQIAREALNTLDERNFWTETRTDAAKSPLKGYVAAEVYDGREGEYITTGTFSTRMEQLCNYLEALLLTQAFMPGVIPGVSTP